MKFDALQNFTFNFSEVKWYKRCQGQHRRTESVSLGGLELGRVL